MGEPSRAACALALGLTLGCAADPPTFPEQGSTTSTMQGSSGAPMTTTADTDPGSGATTIAADDDGGGSSTSSASTDGTPASSGPAAESTGSSRSEHLQHTPWADCSTPLWCFDGSPGTPAGGPIWIQACFTSTLDPPFELTAIDAVVANFSVQLQPFALEVRAYDAGPSDLLLYQELIDPSRIVVGDNSFVLDAPVILTEPTFCVGFAATAPDLGSALGIGVDVGTPMSPGVSFMRMSGPSACMVPEFIDLVGSGAIPTGNWCIGVDVGEL